MGVNGNGTTLLLVRLGALVGLLVLGLVMIHEHREGKYRRDGRRAMSRIEHTEADVSQLKEQMVAVPLLRADVDTLQARVRRLEEVVWPLKEGRAFGTDTGRRLPQ